MCSSRLSAGRLAVFALAAGGFIVALVAGCGTEPPARWPWWAEEDSAAVRAELGRWRAVFDAAPAMSGALMTAWRVGLNSTDSTSATGDTIYKFAGLLSFALSVEDSGHADIYQFGVTVDTVAMSDTFCEVTYRDSALTARAWFEYDSLWVVGFKPDTLVDTTVTPPETTVVYRPSYTELRGFEAPQRAEKVFSWSAMRKLFLSHDRIPDDVSYELTKTTGFASYVPTSEDAPSILRILLSRPGRVDTVFYSPREDGRGLYNLRFLDSLYTVAPDEQVGITVTTSTPPDTSTEKNRFFLSCAGVKTEITADARRGSGTFSFADTGYSHVYVEVAPLSNLLYPDAEYSGTVWAIPVRVTNP